MSSPLTASQKTASALRRAETALRNWQDEPNSPRGDVDKMLAIIADLRLWVQGHVLADVENAHLRNKNAASRVTGAEEAYEPRHEPALWEGEGRTEPDAF